MLFGRSQSAGGEKENREDCRFLPITRRRAELVTRQPPIRSQLGGAEKTANPI